MREGLCPGEVPWGLLLSPGLFWIDLHTHQTQRWNPTQRLWGHPFPAPSPFTYNKQASSFRPTQDRGSVLWREQAAMAQGWCKCTSKHTPSAQSQRLPMHTTKLPVPVPLLPAPKGQATHRRWAVGHLHWGSEEGVCLVHGIHSQPSCPLIRALR